MNTFTDLHRHNLHVGMQNAINALKSGLPDVAIEFLENTKEILSLIEPEGEGWISVSERLPNIGERVIIHCGPYSIHVCYLNVYGTWKLSWDSTELIYEPTHWKPLPMAPVTLSEASKHNFQQAVDESFIDQESDVQGITSKN